MVNNFWANISVVSSDSSSSSGDGMGDGSALLNTKYFYSIVIPIQRIVL